MKGEHSEHVSISLDTPLQFIRSVGPKRAEAFASAGLHSVKDLLYYVPYAYIDRTSVNTLSQLQQSLRREQDIFSSPIMPTIANDLSIKSEAMIIARLISVQEKKYGKSAKSLLIGKIMDDSGGTADIVFFNMVHYFKKILKPDSLLSISGIPDYDAKWRKLSFQHPELSVLDEEEQQEFSQGVILPKYRLTQTMKNAHLTIKIIRSIVAIILDGLRESINETLPDSLLTELSLPMKYHALCTLHQPRSAEELILARKRMKFEELLFFQISLELRRAGLKHTEKGLVFPAKSPSARLLHDSLPFELTQDQKRALWDISNDVSSGKPMNRLIQGDVGSGKTIVSLLAMLMAVDAGYQTLLMAPTEILAEQHYHSVKTMLEPLGIPVAQLLGGQKNSLRQSTLKSIQEGYSKVIIGTHALFSGSKEHDSEISYHNLGLIIIDEQHRFGVEQRARLRSLALQSMNDQQSMTSPHMLVMSATPIPRTLSMTVYGDLDSTIIKELPKGRKSIQTEIVFESTLDSVYESIRQQIQEGHQAYIVFPLVEKSDKIDAKSAVEHYEFLSSEIFPDISCGLLHGKMHWQEKEEVMKSFKAKEYQILIATTVVEVGIDVPNATVILIENAERFGLAQLHQLRGRVGRGDAQSYCYLSTKDHFRYQIKKTNAEDIQQERKSAIARLMTMASTNDGFAIAEADMKLRGPGDFMGTRQSGLPQFQFTDLVNDIQIVTLSKNIAISIINGDPQLRKPEHESLRKEYERLRKSDTIYMNIA